MAGKGYWVDRIVKQQDVLYRKGVNAQNRQLARYYKVALEDTKTDIGNLYDKLVKESIDGNIKVNDLYRYNRYFEVVNNLNKKLNVLGQKEIQIDNLNFNEYGGLELTAEAARFYTSGRARFTPPGGHILQ